MSDRDIEEGLLHAYVDGQLDVQLQQRVLQAMYCDSRVREQVVQLRMTKDLIKAGFPLRHERNSVPPGRGRVLRLMRQYPNLHFVACANSIRQLQVTGNEVLMITDVHSGTTAVDHIVSRLGEGWSYRRIDHLSGV